MRISLITGKVQDIQIRYSFLKIYICEKCIEKNKNIYVMFTNLEKAYDRGIERQCGEWVYMCGVHGRQASECSEKLLYRDSKACV